MKTLKINLGQRQMRPGEWEPYILTVSQSGDDDWPTEIVQRLRSGKWTATVVETTEQETEL